MTLSLRCLIASALLLAGAAHAQTPPPATGLKQLQEDSARLKQAEKLCVYLATHPWGKSPILARAIVPPPVTLEPGREVEQVRLCSAFTESLRPQSTDYSLFCLPCALEIDPFPAEEDPDA